MQITITKDDWDRGQCSSAACCAVSLALRRMYPRAKEIITTYHRIRIDHQEYHHTVESDAFLRDFDRDKRNEPVFPLILRITECCSQ